MDEEEYKTNSEMLGKIYRGVIRRNILTGVNMEIVVGDPNSTHIIFPLSYINGSTYVGNIFENPELK